MGSFFRVEKKLGNGVYSLKTTPLTNVDVTELKIVLQLLQSSERADTKDNVPDTNLESPCYSLYHDKDKNKLHYTVIVNVHSCNSIVN